MSKILEHVSVLSLKPYAHNARTHSKRQIEQIAHSIQRFGFTNPVLVDSQLGIIAGHGRVEAAKRLGMDTVPIIRLSNLSAAEKQAYIIADNRLAQLAGWDKEVLAIELQGLIDLDFDIELVGFETAEIDLILDQARDANAKAPDEDDRLPPLPDAPVSQVGDVWVLGRHRLLCGDALERASYDALMDGCCADAIFTDPPYNVRIDGFAGGKGRVNRREFAMASGEMTTEAFTAFLQTALSNSAAVTKDGAIAFVCMDWRHIGELLSAGSIAFDELKNICVWAKTNGGMGSLYRSQHEFVFVYKRGSEQHCNNVALGRFGRNRTNLWSYAGANAFGATRDDDLQMHPTVKPVAMIEDAIKDVTRRGEIVLDPFGGAGSTLIAAERCGRVARLIEIDPAYCDVMITRWQRHCGRAARLSANGDSFEQTALARTSRSIASALETEHE